MTWKNLSEAEELENRQKAEKAMKSKGGYQEMYQNIMDQFRLAREQEANEIEKKTRLDL